MGQTVLTCLTFKPPGPPPHAKLYSCGLYFASFLPGKQWSRLQSLLQEKPACVSCASQGSGQSFHYRTKADFSWSAISWQTHYSLQAPWKGDQTLGASQGAAASKHRAGSVHTRSLPAAVPTRPLLPGPLGMHSRALGALQGTASDTSPSWDSPNNNQGLWPCSAAEPPGLLPSPQHRDLQPCFASVLSLAKQG